MFQCQINNERNPHSTNSRKGLGPFLSEQLDMFRISDFEFRIHFLSNVRRFLL